MSHVRRHATVVIVAVALLLRLAVIAATPDFAPAGDPADYDRHATALAGAQVYPPTALAAPFSPSALRPPGYPVVLGVAYALPGDDRTAGRLLGALLGTLAVLLVLLLATRLFGPRAGRWAGAAAAVLGPLVWLNASLLSESLFVPLVLGAVLLALDGRSLPKVAAAGALLGAAALTRTNGAVLLLPLAVALLAPRDRRAVAATAVALAAFALTLVPWTVRNASEFGRFLPLGTQSGYTLAGQWNDVAAAPGELQAAWRIGQDVPALRGLFGRPDIDEAELDAELRRRALRFARDRPRHVLAALRLNSLRLLDLGPGRAFTTDVALTEMNVPSQHRAGLRLSAYIVFLLAAAGAVVAVRRRLGPLWVWAVPVLLFVSVAPLLGSPRYRAAVDPFLAILAGLAVSAWRERRGARTVIDRNAV